MKKRVAFITPTHSKDIERFALLCESIDRYVTGYQRHIVIVNDDDLCAFSRFNSDHRIVLPCSRFLPRWLRLVPRIFARKGRRVWWSFRSGPVHGWHIQQLLKIAAVLQSSEERYCLVDSDNVFFRPFDLNSYSCGEKCPLYVDPAKISADSPLHSVWTQNCDRLLGHSPTPFPADDYIGNLIVWDQTSVQSMTGAIEQNTGQSWQLALCKTRSFSEYLLYGHFVRHSPEHLAQHQILFESLACAYWEGSPLDRAAVAEMAAQSPAGAVALCIESFSRTPVSAIREALSNGH